MHQQPLFTGATIERGARFSPCEHWRYELWRVWDPNKPRVMFIGLNPSTADATHDDPTVRRCINFGTDWGYGGMWMMNAYAFRATNPQDMFFGRHHAEGPVVTDDPIGPENDGALAMIGRQAMMVIAAWGNNIDEQRQKDVVAIFERIRKPVYCLERTKTGRPRHPLYVKSERRPELW